MADCSADRTEGYKVKVRLGAYIDAIMRVTSVFISVQLVLSTNGIVLMYIFRSRNINKATESLYHT